MLYEDTVYGLDFLKSTFSFLIFSVARSKVYWYGLGSVSLASVQSIDR